MVQSWFWDSWSKMTDRRKLKTPRPVGYAADKNKELMFQNILFYVEKHHKPHDLEKEAYKHGTMQACPELWQMGQWGPK